MPSHWTKEQEDALNARGQNLLLSAAAGSGKTAVLTERITRLVADPDSGCDVNDLLVLTFTKAAASEMKSRVSSSLMAALTEADAADDTRRVRHLERQIALLGSAQISTLDSFFQSLIRQYFYLLDLDPKTRVLSDENENYLLKEDVLAGVLENWYEKQDPDFLDLADFFASHYQDAAFRDTLLSIHNFSRSMPFPEEWLRHLPDAYHVTGSHLCGVRGGGALLSSLQGAAETICDLYRRAFSIMEEFPAAQAVYEDKMGEEFTFFSGLAKASHWQDFFGLPPFSYTSLKAATNAQMKPFGMTGKEFTASPEATAIKELRSQARDLFKRTILPFLSITETEWVSQMEAMEPIVKVLSAVLLDFSKALDTRKKEERVMDFNDMEHYALDILVDRGNPAFTPRNAADFPSEAALSLRQRYKEVMIDEYQDTNGIQELITALISNGRNRFMVGDIKQSIYRFRQADPTIFLEKYRAYEADPATPNRRIDLNRNFRSDGVLLSSINFLFRQFLTKDALELTYGDREALYPGRREETRPAAYVGGPVEIDVVDKSPLKEAAVDDSARDLENITLEGRLIARRIQDMMAGGAQVMNKDGTFRPLDYGDVVILLRSAAGKAPILLKVLEENHIPAVSDREDDFVRNNEVEILLALLKLLDNPLQDIPLTAVLRSHFVSLDEKDLTLLSLHQKQQQIPHLFPVLAEADSLLATDKAGLVDTFLTRFHHWREEAMGDGIAPLLRTILEETGYLTYLSGLSRGTARKNHVMAFYQLALSRDSSSHNGLYNFLDYLAKLSKDNREFKSESAGAAAGAVRIMTIHRSKGLEFPVVFLADAAKPFNLSDTKSGVICHKTMGLGIRYYDKAHMAAWPTFYWYAVRTAAARESQAEEARLLYVAMTRARDKLIITATPKDAAKLLSVSATPLAGTDAGYPTALPSHLISGANSYLDWILPAALRHKDLKPVWTRLELPPVCQADAPGDTSHFHFQLVSALDLLTPAEKAQQEADTDEKAPAVMLPKAKTPARSLETFLANLPTSWPDWMDRQLTWTYDHSGATETPAKLTATAAVKLREAREYALADEPPYASATLAEDEEEPATEALPADYAEPPQFLESGAPRYTGTSYGTLMHKAMEMLDFTKLPPDSTAIRSAIQDLTEKQVFNAEEAKTLLSTRKNSPVESLLTFSKGPLASLMKGAAAIHKEMPFSILLPADSFYPQCEPGEHIFLQGVMDCLLTLKDGLVIIDYKTDHTMTEKELADHYKVQLQVYGEAAEKLLGRPVLHLYLWSFRYGKAIEVEKNWTATH